MKLETFRMVFNALADETRLRILNLLAEGELCVCDIVGVLREPQSKVSRHLAYLRRAGLAQARKEGLWMHYELTKLGRTFYGCAEKAWREGRSRPEEFKTDITRFRKNKPCLVATCR
ncbi:MAG: metalloregulator ArsR/SmtB family transcription factor [Candidatus Omnitrophica bacterium]|nr:metalloregulator ArsR/SmtB family transcription factor [Candidatus Omnitrophota bacterium]